MTPAVSPGDHILMENLTFLCRAPRRGDIVVFKADTIASESPGTIFLKRVVGEPGEHVRISGGKLFVNEQEISLRNAAGEIAYVAPRFEASGSRPVDVTVPNGYYFVLGDNSANSFDSRFWGSLPRNQIIGRAWLCFWPPGRMGTVK